jgi:hypothetical protein
VPYHKSGQDCLGSAFLLNALPILFICEYFWVAIVLGCILGQLDLRFS